MDIFVDQTITQLDALVARPGLELVGCRIVGITVEGAQLHGLRMEGCTVTDCDLRLASLRGTQLGDTTFVGCNLTGIDWTTAAWSAFGLADALRLAACTLDYGTFRGITLPGLMAYGSSAVDVDFGECDLTDADLRFTDLTDADFDRTTLIGADLTGAVGFAFDPRAVRARRTAVSWPEAGVLLGHLGFEVSGPSSPEPVQDVLARGHRR